MENNSLIDIRICVNSESGKASAVVVNENLQMAYVKSNDVTWFAGTAKTEYFFRPMVSAKVLDLLIKGFNNRTRERNYFKLYCQLLSNEITDDEFDKEIEEKEDKYVVDVPGTVSPEDVCTAVCLSDRLMDIKTTEDFTSVFGIDDNSIEKYIKLIENE